ncbi:hypothetical protein ES332_A10G158000v1 [Gossypium tomentosum]|uniref:Transmembrane protein n=1 Tax=Gossypium tomentosum TaxID=34277 RepID=A0A5D2NTL6_GOSTO|nr:hypothetical protein ES332_A10G158000v1 [Gossypium tomentosum]
MAYKVYPMLFLLALLLSLSLLLPSSSTTKVHLIIKESYEVIQKNLIGAKPPPYTTHGGGGGGRGHGR